MSRKQTQSFAAPLLQTTPWSGQVTPDNVWPEYPRPQLVRSSWINLNGSWEYSFHSSPEDTFDEMQGSILVPFSPESPLSGVRRQLKPGELLRYRRWVLLPLPKKGRRLLLHFGAVDQQCRVLIDGKEAGRHSGGYLPFTLDITRLLPQKDPCRFELTVFAKDPSDTALHSRGKQKLKRGGMFYTAQSGIWQTVWLEEVPSLHIREVRITPDYDNSCCRLLVHCSDAGTGRISLTARIRPETEEDSDFRRNPENFDPEERKAADRDSLSCRLTPDTETLIPLPGFHPWSPEDPFLYHMTLEIDSPDGDGDRAECYFGMRKCDVQTDSRGIQRLYLNNAAYMQTGVLDQGYWPDGLYTAPCDEALVRDILSMKELGFNMLRKHVKIEPQRWYYHCDRLGMLVWQDMVCGGSSYRHWFVTYLATLLNTFHISIPDGPGSRRLLSRRDKAGREEFLREVKETMETLHNHPSIVCWVPFNEGWGQFDARQVGSLVHSLDPSRLTDHASGWFDQGGGDLVSLHYYFFRLRFRPEPARALALTEYGGYSRRIPEHSWNTRQYGYGKYDSRSSLTEGYRQLHEDTVIPAVKKGISATVYTQLSDVEDEVNGFFTYDREVLKMDAGTVRRMNQMMKEAIY